MNPEAPVIEVLGLSRSYGKRRNVIHAVREASFTAGRGMIFGLIGPDGAGKTSIIQMLAGVLDPHAGSAKVLGIDVVRDPEGVKRRIGYMPQGLGANLYDNLTVQENIEFFRDLRMMPNAEYERNRASLLRMTRLAPFVNRRAANLSGGMRQKLALICTLIHLPDILLLDEPTTGVDPISRQEFWQIIGGIVEERGATVLLSTSYMDEAERCHQIALLHSGTIIAQGTPQDLRSRAVKHYATVRSQRQDKALGLIRTLSEVTSAEVYGEDIRIGFNGDLRNIETKISNSGIPVEHASLQVPTLEDVYLEMLNPEKSLNHTVHFDAQNSTSLNSIEARGLTRRFGGFTAVEHVDLRIHRGEIFGLLGPNGAGKTTLIKMLCGLAEPTAGQVLFDDVVVHTNRVKASHSFGYMSQRFSLYRDLTVGQNLRLYSDLYGVDRAQAIRLLERLGLQEFEHRLTRDLSAGIRQRMSLLCAILHNPAIVFLDEPTSGVDPQARRVFWDLIYSLSREAGVTVVVSTHYMDEAIHCDRLGLMDDGRLIAVATPTELKRKSEERSGCVLSIHAANLRQAYKIVVTRFPAAILYGDSIRMRSHTPHFDKSVVADLIERGGIHDARVDEVPLSMDETFIDFIHSEDALHA